MKKKDGHTWVIVGGIIILIGLYNLFQTIQVRTSHKTVTGTITKVEYEDQDSGGYIRYVYYDFYLGDKKYEGYSSNEAGNEGEPIKVYYATNNPEYNTTHEALSKTGFRFFLDWILFIGGIVGLIFYVKWYIKNFWIAEETP